MRVKGVIAAGIVLAMSAFAFAQVNSNITSSSWNGSADGWVGGGQWGQFNPGNDWTNGDLRMGGIATSPNSQLGLNWAGMTYDLTGNTSATLTTTSLWRAIDRPTKGYTEPYKDRFVGMSLMTMELNGIGVAMTIFTGQEQNAWWDLNGFRPTGANADAHYLQLIQYDHEGNFKLLNSFNLTQWDNVFRGGDPGGWNFPEFMGSLTIDGTAVTATFGAVGQSTTWNYNLTSTGAVGNQAQWGAGSSIFVAGGDTRIVWNTINLTAVPEPASLCLLALGSIALLRRR